MSEDIKIELRESFNSEIQARCHFFSDFDAEIHINSIDIVYRLDVDFNVYAEIEIDLDVISERVGDNRVSYFLKTEICLYDSDCNVFRGRDFHIKSSIETDECHLMHEKFLESFHFVLQHELSRE